MISPIWSFKLNSRSGLSSFKKLSRFSVELVLKDSSSSGLGLALHAFEPEENGLFSCSSSLYYSMILHTSIFECLTSFLSSLGANRMVVCHGAASSIGFMFAAVSNAHEFETQS